MLDIVLDEPATGEALVGILFKTESVCCLSRHHAVHEFEVVVILGVCAVVKSNIDLQF